MGDQRDAHWDHRKAGLWSHRDNDLRLTSQPGRPTSQPLSASLPGTPKTLNGGTGTSKRLGEESLGLSQQLTPTDQRFALAAGLERPSNFTLRKQRTNDIGHDDSEVENRVSRQPKVGRDMGHDGSLFGSPRGERAKSRLKSGACDEWRQPHQPHPGTQCSRCGCSLPGLTRLTGNRCGGTDGVTITTLAWQRAGPLYRSGAKIQPLNAEKILKGFKHLGDPLHL